MAVPPSLKIALLLMLPGTAGAAGGPTNWEVCLDKADFKFTLDEFGGSYSVEKASCQVTFAIFGGKGEKFQIDLCDPVIHIDHYNAIDAASFDRVAAGSAGCPKPMFGADFDDNAKDIREYRELKSQVLDLWGKFYKRYTEDKKVNMDDINKPNFFREDNSLGRAGCGQLLLTEYLSNCMSFEAKKAEAKFAPAPNIPGVHPQTILVPKSPGK